MKAEMRFNKILLPKQFLMCHEFDRFVQFIYKSVSEEIQK